MRFVLAAFLMVCVSSAQAGELVLSGAVEQGNLAFGQTEPGAQVLLNDKRVPVADDGSFLMGFGRNATSAVLRVTHPDGTEERRTLAVATRQWKVQRIDGLPPKQVTPDPETQKRTRYENGLIGKARRMVTREPFYKTGFIMPAKGPLSGVFGSQRILNGQPRSPHSGTDVAAPYGSPVLAMGDGVVSLVNDDMFYTGMTVMIDHGYGLQSVYAHMSAIKVVNGQWVPKGTVIGKVGKTGRVTGPHLHFGVSWFSIKLDPQSVLSALPAGGAKP